MARFRTRRERDDYLKRELQSVNTALEDQSGQLTQLTNDIATTQSNLTERETTIKQLQQQLDSHRDQLDAISTEWAAAKRSRDDLYEKRKDLWRQDAQLDAMIASQREECRKADQMLFSTMDKGTSSGLAAVRRIVDQYKIPGYFGAVYELFEVDAVYTTAVEVTAGQRYTLFLIGKVIQITT
jgi:structural maintenance of chromosome 3 (chondroitin sulfate proteoglycan 6)